MYSVHQEIFPTNISKFPNSSNIFRVSVLPFNNSFAIFRYFVLNLSVRSQCRLLRCPLASSGVCLSSSFCHTASFFLVWSQLQVMKWSRDAVMRPDGIVRWSVATTLRNVWNDIAFAHMKRNLIDCVFVQHVNKFFCSGLSSAFVNSVVSFVDCFIWCVYKLSLCQFCRWCQCSSVEWEGISNSVFNDLVCRRRYFDFFKWAYLIGQQLVYDSVARLTVQMYRGWPVSLDVLYWVNHSGALRIFRSWLSLYQRCGDYIRLSASWPIVETRCSWPAFSVCSDFVAVSSVGKAVGWSKAVGTEG